MKRPRSALVAAEARVDCAGSAFVALPVIDAAACDRGRVRPAVGRFDLLRTAARRALPAVAHARRGAATAAAAAGRSRDLRRTCAGRKSAPMNLAGVLPWIHWRGLLVLGLLVAGNCFCLACPFTLAALAGPAAGCRPGATWPRWLRSKWLAVSLAASLFLWSYEAFALWDSPWWTAWIAIAYFVAAFAVDGSFAAPRSANTSARSASSISCNRWSRRWRCELREPAACAACQTHECIRGRDDAPGLRAASVSAAQARQYGLHVLPRLRACLPARQRRSDCRPAGHANCGIDPVRSGIGRFSRRPDLAVLVLVLVFGAFANAGGDGGAVVATSSACALTLRAAVTTMDHDRVLISWPWCSLPLVAITIAAGVAAQVGAI